MTLTARPSSPSSPTGHLTDDQIVRSLIAYYHNTGVDLSTLLNDPIFEKLPIGSKVDAIKKYAATIVQGSSKNPGKPYHKAILNSGLLGAGTGAFTGMGAGFATWAAMKPFPLGTLGSLKALAYTVGSGALLGGASAAISSYLEHKGNITARENMHNQLRRTAESPTTENALGLLSSNYISSKRDEGNQALRRRLDSYIIPAIDNAGKELLPGTFTKSYNRYNAEYFTPQPTAPSFPDLPTK